MKPRITAAGDIVRIERWKEWWQVKVVSATTTYTVFQSKSMTQAKSYIEQCYHFPAESANLGTWNVNQKRGRVVRNIVVYP